MSRILLLCLLLPAALSGFAQPRRLPVEAELGTVTIFSTGARVERSATTALQQGRTEVVFTGLSNQLDPQSVQLKADANITLLSVQATRDFLSQRRIDTEERSFLEKIQQLSLKKENDEKQLQIYTKEEEMLTKNQEIGGTTGVKAPELKAVLDLHRQRLAEIYDKQLEYGRRIADETRELDRLRAQLQQFSRKRDSVYYVVTALVDSREARNVRFGLSYNVKDAGWHATYDLRVGEVGKPLALVMNANVFQRSGETWKDVNLFLSTGNPNDNATPSKLQPWMLGFYDAGAAAVRGRAPGDVSGRITDENGAPVPFANVSVSGAYNQSTAADANGYFRMSGVPQGATLVVSAAGYGTRTLKVQTGYYNLALARQQQSLDEVVVTGYAMRNRDDEGAGRALQGKVAGVQVVSVQTDYQPTTIVYKIDEKYTIETDGKMTTIGIKSVEVPASYEYVAAPKVDPAVFLNARITGWQQLDLVSGEASLYFEGTFLGKTYLDLGGAADTLTVGLGKDNNVRVTRKLVKEYSTKKFLGSNRIDTRGWEITVRNNKRVPVTISLTDQVPVSTVKEISVDEVKTDGQLEKETGLITWQVEVAPGTEKKLHLSYEVKYPKDRRVTLE